MQFQHLRPRRTSNILISDLFDKVFTYRKNSVMSAANRAVCTNDFTSKSSIIAHTKLCLPISVHYTKYNHVLGQKCSIAIKIY